jgi:hypothetical protein
MTANPTHRSELRWKGVRLLLLAGAVIAPALHAAPIDRFALVGRHAPHLTRVDRHAPLMVGNGNIGFTADITGLQTFPEQYSAIAPLLTMAQWSWHSFPNPKGYTEADGLVQVPVPGRGDQPYPWIRDWAELDKRPALVWLRENPHRFSLGRVGLALTRRDGSPARFVDLSETRQRLDLWTGALVSNFRFDGQPVTVETRLHPQRDMLVVSIRSPLVASGRVGAEVRFPGVARKLNPDPSDWARDESHRTLTLAQAPGRVEVERRLDDTVYFSTISAPGTSITATGPHGFKVVRQRGDRIELVVSFDRERNRAAVGSFASAVSAVTAHWRNYWSKGGVVDFSGSTDPRAAELERRVVLSQYLSAINGAGALPPQEEGLFSNSWNGKFHLEMHPLHSGHFATWGRPELLERSLGWYAQVLPQAKAEAKRHSVEGAWWTKMTGPEHRNSPSTVNPFIMWQQPHPIYMAELAYRAHPGKATLARYAEVVDETARLLASWPRRDEASGTYVLGPPIIPVQENHPPLTSFNPTFEIEYFRWGLRTAQTWRERRGLARVPAWDRVIAGLAPPPEEGGLYLPAGSATGFWRDTKSARCRGNAVEPCMNRDHPSFLMAYGFIAGDRIDRAKMLGTLRATEDNWDLRQTWGWDFPIVAMTAARLGDPESAVDWLFKDIRNNKWGVGGMTPRVHLDAHAQAFIPTAGKGVGPDGPGYNRAAETYFPSNGSLLLAVGMMAAGWDGSSGPAPGFPKKTWKVRVEGIKPAP